MSKSSALQPPKLSGAADRVSAETRASRLWLSASCKLGISFSNHQVNTGLLSLSEIPQRYPAMVSAYLTDALRDPTGELQELYASSTSEDFPAEVTKHFSHVFEKDEAFRQVCAV